MLKKIGQGLLKTELKIKNSVYRFFHEEKGGTEVVAILFIIIILVGIVVIFRDQLGQLISNLFNRISNDVNSDL